MSYRKLGLSLSVILVFLAYVSYQKSQNNVPVVAGTTGTSVSVESIRTGGSTEPAPKPTTTPVRQQVGIYKDGQYLGPVIDAYYGNVQVKITISGGKLVDVVFLDYPKDRSTSVRINTQAMPYLKQEAITAQSARVDIVGGATETSGAFQKSLSAALAQAKT